MRVKCTNESMHANISSNKCNQTNNWKIVTMWPDDQTQVTQRSLCSQCALPNCHHPKCYCVVVKGQLISEWFFGVSKSSKKLTFTLTDFCPSLEWNAAKVINHIFFYSSNLNLSAILNSNIFGVVLWIAFFGNT